MYQGIRILYNINFICNVDDLVENLHDMAEHSAAGDLLFAEAREERKSLIKDILKYLPGDVDGLDGIETLYVDENIDTSLSSSELILGAERPEELIHEAQHWNDDLLDNVIVELRRFEAQVQENGGSNCLSDYFSALKNSGVDAFPGVLNLATALESLGNDFVYGNDQLVLENGMTDVVLSKEALERIKKHPEEWIWVEAMYD